jgi:hypothetical protein
MADFEHLFSNKVIPTGLGYPTPTILTSGQHPNIFMVRTQIDW